MMADTPEELMDLAQQTADIYLLPTYVIQDKSGECFVLSPMLERREGIPKGFSRVAIVVPKKWAIQGHARA